MTGLFDCKEEQRVVELSLVWKSFHHPGALSRNLSKQQSARCSQQSLMRDINHLVRALTPLSRFALRAVVCDLMGNCGGCVATYWLADRR